MTGGIRSGTACPRSAPARTTPTPWSPRTRTPRVVAGFQVLETLPPQLVMVQGADPNITGTGPPPVVHHGHPRWECPDHRGDELDVRPRLPTPDTLLFDFGDAPRASARRSCSGPGSRRTASTATGNPIVPGFRRIVELHRHQRARARRSTPAAARRRTSSRSASSSAKILTSAEVTVPGAHRQLDHRRRRPRHVGGRPGQPDDRRLPAARARPAGPGQPVQPSERQLERLHRAAHPLPHAQRVWGVGNQVLLTWSWTGTFPLSKGASGTAHGSTRSCARNASGQRAERGHARPRTTWRLSLQRIADLAITSETVLRGNKEVRGDRDTGFLSFPVVGNTTRGGTANYRATIRNVSDVAVTDIIVLDTMPIPGDIGLKDFTPEARSGNRCSPASSSSNPPCDDGDVLDAHNPCRLELSVNPPDCVPPNWSTQPGDLASVGAIKVDFGSLVLNPNDSITLHLGGRHAGQRAGRRDRVELVRLHRHPTGQRLSAGVGRTAEGRVAGRGARRAGPAALRAYRLQERSAADLAGLPGRRAGPGWCGAHAVPAPAVSAG